MHIHAQCLVEQSQVLPMSVEPISVFSNSFFERVFACPWHMGGQGSAEQRRGLGMAGAGQGKAEQGSAGQGSAEQRPGGIAQGTKG